MCMTICGVPWQCRKALLCCINEAALIFALAVYCPKNNREEAYEINNSIFRRMVRIMHHAYKAKPVNAAGCWPITASSTHRACTKNQSPIVPEARLYAHHQIAANLRWRLICGGT